MSKDLVQFGRDLREVLRGLLQAHQDEITAPDTRIRRTKPSLTVWGQYVDPASLPNLYKDDGAPERHVPHRYPPPGIDHMHLKTTDTFLVPGRGEVTVDFKGYFQVTRGRASSDKWETARMVFNYTHFKLFGRDPQLGPITVDLNPDFVSGGETFFSAGEAKCRAATSARFHLHDLGLTVFNKEPLLLRNGDMKGIPTIGEGGRIDVFHHPLYDIQDPEGEPKVYLEALEYTVLNYMNKDEALAYQRATSQEHFNELASA